MTDNCPFCPVCYCKLYPRRDGSVCKNKLCPLYHRLGVGWILSRVGIWVYQDKRILRDIKLSLRPNINWVQILLGAYAISIAKDNKKEVVK